MTQAELKEAVAAIAPDAVAWRRHLHRNPETAFEEYDTAAFIEKTLRDSGVTGVRRIGGTGVVALIEGASPGGCVGLRADIDALPLDEDTGLPYASQRPGAAHLCGHDIHTAVLLGAGKILAENRGAFSGSVKLLFQPAEETLSGAARLIEEGVMQGPKVERIFGLHCWPDLLAGTVGVQSGAMMAGASNFSIVVKGRQGHGAHPHRAVDPVLIASHIVLALQSLVSREIAPVDPAVVSIGKIHGGFSSNTIPGTVTIEGTFRTLAPAPADLIASRIREIATGLARDMRGEAEVALTKGVPPLQNDEDLCGDLRHRFAAAFGEEGVIRLTVPSMGSEDFAEYLAHCPGCLFRLGVGAPGGKGNPPLHAKDFVADDSAVATGILAMTTICCEG